MSANDDLIARAEAALEGVTPGPWQSEWPLDGDDDFPSRYVASAVTTQCTETAVAKLRADQSADASFIAAARQLVPDLLARITAQNAEIARLEGQRQVAHGETLTLAADLLQEKIAHNAAKAEIERLRAERDRDILAEKMRMMEWCAKRQAVSRKSWERAARKALAGDMAELRNRIAMIDAGPMDIVLSDAALTPPETEGRG